MKTIVRFFGLSVTMILCLLIHSAILSNSTHHQELNRIVNQAMTETQRVISDKRYPISNNDEYIAEFMQHLYLGTISKSNYEIAIYGIDYEKGFLDIEVFQTFKQVTGKSSTISVRKIGIVDRNGRSE